MRSLFRVGVWGDIGSSMDDGGRLFMAFTLHRRCREAMKEHVCATLRDRETRHRNCGH